MSDYNSDSIHFARFIYAYAHCAIDNVMLLIGNASDLKVSSNQISVVSDSNAPARVYTNIAPHPIGYALSLMRHAMPNEISIHHRKDSCIFRNQVNWHHRIL